MDLAAFGNKHVGTAEGAMAGDYVRGRMEMMGLADVHFESFQFPRQDIQNAAVAVTVDGAPQTPGADAFDGTGAGHVDADVVYVGFGTASELAGKNITGKIALVDRSTQTHRSIQYLNLVNAGASAMLYVSMTTGNLRQVGSVRLSGGTAMGAIPAVTIGNDDGALLEQAIMMGKTVHAVIDVAATSTPAMGRNVIGRVVGSDAAGPQIIIGAHYDTWFTGSVDNGGGTAALLALAARRAKESQPRCTLIFIAYDGEEVGLYGGYDYLRKHHVLANDPILAVVNFEMPASLDAATLGLARSNVSGLDQALSSAGLPHLYPFYVGMDLVPQIFAGVIPTDIQGIYRSGVPTATTAVDTAYYHTTSDTPDKVDIKMLAKAVDEFDSALDRLMALPLSSFSAPDPKLWRATLAVQPRQAADPLVVGATLTDSTGAPQAGVTATANLFVDDFFDAGTQTATTDSAGRASFTFPASAAAMGSGNRFVHMTAGPMWPLVEAIAPVSQ